MYKGKLIDDIELSRLPIAVIEIIDRFKSNIKQESKVGTYQLTEGKAFYFIVNDKTERLEDRRSEIHRKYIDVQIVLEGEETFGYSNHPFLSIDEDHLEERDVAFSEGIFEEQFVTLQAGEFVVFKTEQPHRPLIAPNDPAPVKKAVIKIDKSLIN